MQPRGGDARCGARAVGESASGGAHHSRGALAGGEEAEHDVPNVGGDGVDCTRGVDAPEARLRVQQREIALAHPLVELAALALEAVEVPAADPREADLGGTSRRRVRSGTMRPAA